MLHVKNNETISVRPHLCLHPTSAYCTGLSNYQVLLHFLYRKLKYLNIVKVEIFAVTEKLRELSIYKVSYDLSTDHHCLQYTCKRNKNRFVYCTTIKNQFKYIKPPTTQHPVFTYTPFAIYKNCENLYVRKKISFICCNYCFVITDVRNTKTSYKTRKSQDFR